MSVFYCWIFLAAFGWYRASKQARLSSGAVGWKLTLNSAVLYALAFNIIFFIQELFLALGKYWLGLKAVLYHNNHNWYGNHPQESLAQGYGAVAILVSAVIFTIVFFAMRKSQSWLKLFVFWLAYQGFMQSLPQFATVLIASETDTGQAFTYLGWNATTGYVLMFISVGLIIGISMASSRYVLELAPKTVNTDDAYKRFSYLFRGAFLPGIIGIILIFPFRIMPLDRAIAPVLVTLISVPWLFAHAWRVKNAPRNDNDVNHKVLAVPVVLLVILLVIFQLVLAPGVVFQP
jgi:hypothetical protein